MSEVSPATQQGNQLLLKAVSRLVGITSLLHCGKREPGDVLPAMRDRLKMEMEQVDSDVWILLGEQQEKAITEIVCQMEAWHEDGEDDDDDNIDEDNDDNKDDYDVANDEDLEDDVDDDKEHSPDMPMGLKKACKM